MWYAFLIIKDKNMSQKLTKFTFYKNTPFTDFVNTINFKSNALRDAYFDSHFTQFKEEIPFNYVRSRYQLDVSTTLYDYQDWSQVNYARFTSEFDDGLIYYAQVTSAEYMNSATIRLQLVPDGLMTFTQGDISQYAKNVMIERQHLTTSTFNNNLKYLRNNDDVLDFNTLSYVHQDLYKFGDLSVVMRTSVDLEKNFGDVDNPKLTTSNGITYDRVVSPQNIYMLEYDGFTMYMNKLKDYPWIARNITSVLLIPSNFIDNNDLVEVSSPSFDYTGLKKFKNGATSKNIGSVKDLYSSWNDIYLKFGVGSQHPELMRNAYTNIELNNFQGQKVKIDLSALPDSGLDIYGQLIIGYDNAAYFFPRYYNSSKQENAIDELFTGSYLDTAIVFKDWDNVPTLVDNYKMSMASNAHERALNENNLITGQAGNIVDNSQSLQDRMMSAVNLASNMTVGAVSGKLVDEWQFYRRQKAQFADKAISAPSVSEMSNNNSFAIKQQFFGITAKYSVISDTDFNSAIRYHANFGYEWHRLGNLESTQSMDYLNYVRFSGNWIINDRKVPQDIMEQLRIQFETGVKMWHNPDNLENPFTQDVINNKKVQ